MDQLFEGSASVVTDIPDLDNIFSDANSQILIDYLKNATHDSIESYNDLLDNLGNIFAHMPFKVTYQRRDPVDPTIIRDVPYNIYLTSIKATVPTEPLSTGDRLIYPAECILKGTSYQTWVTGRIISRPRDNFDPAEEISDPAGDFSIFQIPIQVKSRICNLTPLGDDPDKLSYVRETVNNPGGYFVINGVVRIIPYVEKVRYNTIVTNPPGSKKYWTSHQTVSIGVTTARAVVNLVESDFSFSSIKGKSEIVGAVITKLDGMKVKREGEKVKQDDGNVNILFLAELIDKILLGSQYERASTSLNEQLPFQARRPGIIPVFNKMLISLVPRTEVGNILSDFSQTVLNYMDVSYDTHLSNLLVRLDLKEAIMNDGEAIAKYLRSILIDNLFPNISRESGYHKKIWMLAIMTANLLRTKRGYIKPTDRNSWRNKRLDSPGVILRNKIINRLKVEVSIIQAELDELGSQSDLTKFYQKIKARFSRDLLIDAIIKELNETTIKKGDKKEGKPASTQMLSSLNAATRFLKQTSLIIVLVNSNSKNPLLRSISFSQPHYVCLATTTDGSKCGLNKYKASTSRVTLNQPDGPIIQQLIDRRLVLVDFINGRSQIRELPDMTYSRCVLVNSTFFGWGNDDTIRQMVELRNQGIIHRHTSIFVNDAGYIEINTDGGRLVRPVIALKSRELAGIGNVLYQDFLGNQPCYRDLKDRNLITFLDPNEEAQTTIAMSVSRFREVNQKLEEFANNISTLIVQIQNYQDGQDITREQLISSYQQNLNSLNRLVSLYPFKYCNLSSLSLYTAAAGSCNYIDRNQGARQTYATKMAGQFMSPYTDPFSHSKGRFAAVTYASQGGSKLNEIIGLDKFPNQVSLLVAFIDNEWNHEDAIYINRNALQKFAYIEKTVIEATISNSRGDYIVELRRPTLGEYDNPKQYRNMQTNGLPFVGAYMEPDDKIIGIVSIRKTGNDIEIQNNSVSMGSGQYGYVKDIIILPQNEETLVSVLLEKYTLTGYGDKLADLYGQKGVIGKIVNPEDLPSIISAVWTPEMGRNVNPFANQGVTPDLVVNTMCIPSRVTMGKLVELLTGTIAVEHMSQFDATPFSKINQDAILKELRRLGHTDGKYIMLNGITGEQFESRISMGYNQYNLLYEHVASAKASSGSIGKVVPTTRQPAQESGKGAPRHGTMETQLAQSMSALFAFQKVSNINPYEVAVCCGCGLFVENDPVRRCFRCDVCGDNETVVKIVIPYVFKHIAHLLLATGIKLHVNVMDLQNYVDYIAQKSEKEKYLTLTPSN